MVRTLKWSGLTVRLCLFIYDILWAVLIKPFLKEEERRIKSAEKLNKKMKFNTKINEIAKAKDLMDAMKERFKR